MSVTDTELRRRRKAVMNPRGSGEKTVAGRPSRDHYRRENLKDLNNTGEERKGGRRRGRAEKRENARSRGGTRDLSFSIGGLGFGDEKLPREGKRENLPTTGGGRGDEGVLGKRGGRVFLN